MLGLDLAQLFLGAQVDRAEPLAVAAQAFELFLDRDEIGQRLAFLDLGERGDRRRLDFQHVVDFAPDIGKPALGAFEALLGAGEFLARGARPLPSAAWRRGRFRPARFRRFAGCRRSRAARLPPWRFRRSGLALVGENLRRVFQFARSAGLLDALLEGGDLIAGAVAAARSSRRGRRRSSQSLIGQFRLAHDRLRSARTSASAARLAAMSSRTSASWLSISAAGGSSASAALGLRFCRRSPRRGLPSAACALRPTPTAAPPGG